MKTTKSIFQSDTFEKIYKSFFTLNHDACFVLDMNRNIKLFNNAAESLTGYSSDEALEISIQDFLQKDTITESTLHFNKVIEGNEQTFNITIKHKNGYEIDVTITAVPLKVEEQICGIIGIAKELTKSHQMETLLDGQAEVLKMIYTKHPMKDVLDQINLLMEDVISGGTCSILLVDQINEQLIHASSPHLPNSYCKKINGTKIGPTSGSCGTAAYYKKPIITSNIDDDPLWLQYKDIASGYNLKACWSYPILDNHETVLGTFAIYYPVPRTPKKNDIQLINKATHLASLVIQHYHAEEKINFMEYHDDLTMLANRKLFDKYVDEAISRSHDSAEDSLIGMLYLDLDRFKVINETLGHHIGDQLLKKVAQRLKESLREDDMISRQGGDEFSILIKHVTIEQIKTIAQRIIQTLVQPFHIHRKEIFVTPSIGISLYPNDGETVADLLRKADVAMYQAKNSGRNQFEFYNKSLDTQALERLKIENELRKALDKNEFNLVYQPILDLSTNRIADVEALIRWENDTLGSISPMHFIPIAEETGLIIPIGDWVLRTAFKQLELWNNSGYPPISVAINISIRQFYQAGFINQIQQLLQETNVQPDQLTFEITESMTMDIEAAKEILYHLKKLGVNISIDDFGTGYSSLSYLKSLPIDYLKIDKSFINDINTNKDDKSIAITMLTMAQSLGINVIAEGIETNEQLGILQQHLCNKGQGFLFSKPVPVEELNKILEMESVYF
ncbi:EAL domain-containing protein [Aquibacillus koreensis]|uniref:EAL domain-containing protein n=1 Tax=Aquibacillus koreensis TaxID=279446 RepID=A0A9X3WK61_9BACI|nr:EAL domain-containing protein [Aquibacillus koreensis]MCT2534612.1 EAL domain-containing protein [Aquibacillus koreensis]MDC3419796.1 EAL domain-containing protein [Aquibacillus koreensis]